MRAVIGDRFGGIECLRLDEAPSPALVAGTVRIAVRAAGVSFANLLFIAGKHQNRPELPFIPGTEIAGIVTEIAPDVRNGLRIGDRVCAGLPSGGFAEEAVVDANNVFAIPDTLDFAAATLFTTIYATAYAGLVWRAALARDEVLLVHGAAGASGLAAVEIGRAIGARVIATAGGIRKVETASATAPITRSTIARRIFAPLYSTSRADAAPTSCSIRSAATCSANPCAASRRWRGC